MATKMKKSVFLTVTLLLLVIGIPSGLLAWEKFGRAQADVSRNGVQSFAAPVIHAVQWSANRMAKMLQFTVTAGLVHERNEILERRIARLEAENGFLREELAKRQRLSKGAAIAMGDWRAQEADVLAYGGRRWARSLVVSRGAEDKVEAGDPVLHTKGLAGVVTTVSRWTSTVQLLSDPQSAVGVIVLPLRARGIVRGTGDLNALEIVLEDPTVVLREGQKVITSGMEGSLYPRGLPVGTIGELKLNRFGQVIAGVRPAVNYGQIEEVVILKVTPHAKPAAPAAQAAAPSPSPTVSAPKDKARTGAASGASSAKKENASAR